MKLLFPLWAKLVLLIGFISVSVIGFMVKLPSGFRHMDKELHSLFYFLAAAFLNLLFSNKNILWHLLIFGILYLFGAGIERAQEYSNRFFRVRIHGRYDVEDVQSNLKGLIAFSVLWLLIVGIGLLTNKKNLKNK